MAGWNTGFAWGRWAAMLTKIEEDRLAIALRVARVRNVADCNRLQFMEGFRKGVAARDEGRHSSVYLARRADRRVRDYHNRMAEAAHLRLHPEDE